ncbi:hypothetical protein BJY01DRAFT_228499, partial [Aspergillus pseudoustus]
MRARASRCLLQANRRLYGLSFSTPPKANLSAFRSTTRPGIVISAWRRSSRLNATRSSHTNSPPEFQWKDSNVNAMETRVKTPSQPHWENQDIPAVDLPIMPHVFSNFMGFACWGDLPNGQKTSLPLIQEEEAMLWMLPTAEWAPAPYNTGTEAACTRMFLHTTSHGNADRVSLVGKNIHSFKTHLMEGLVPLSETQWTEKDLNNPDRLEAACEYLTGVTAVFEYLSISKVENNLRDTFNLISDDLQELGAALNARRKIHSPHLPDIDLPALWVEFMAARYEVMTNTAHSWMLSKVTQLKGQLLVRFCAVSGLPAEKVPAEQERLQRLWQFLTDITTLADIAAWILMDGYKGYRPPSGIVPGLHNPGLDALAKAYQPRFQELSVLRLNEVIKAQTKAGNADSVTSLKERVSATTYAQDQLRLEMRGQSPEPLTAPWIEFLIRAEQEMRRLNPQKENHTFGFAIYGSAGKLHNDEWNVIKRKVEDHVASWGEGIKGAERVKPLLKLYWHDCKELGLDANDTEAVKNHFRTSRAADTSPLGIGIEETTLLIIDSWSLASYRDSKTYNLHLKEKAYLPGDFQPHLLAVDASFIPDSEPPANNNESEQKDEMNHKDADEVPTPFPDPVPPKFTGHIRILGNLVWGELYALVARNCVRLEDLFPLAMEHPQKLYTGLTVPSQIRDWREQTTIKNSMMDSFVKYLEKKDPKAAEKVREMRERHV